MYNVELSSQEIEDLLTCIATRMVKLDDYSKFSRKDKDKLLYFKEKERIYNLLGKINLIRRS